VRCRCLHRVNTVIKVGRFIKVERFEEVGRIIKVERFTHGSGGHPLAWSIPIGPLAPHLSLPS
jgi:hypothetical protein